MRYITLKFICIFLIHFPAFGATDNTCSTILESDESITEKISKVSFLTEEESYSCLESLKMSTFFDSPNSIEEAIIPRIQFSLNYYDTTRRIQELISSLINSKYINRMIPRRHPALNIANKRPLITSTTYLISFNSVSTESSPVYDSLEHLIQKRINLKRGRPLNIIFPSSNIFKSDSTDQMNGVFFQSRLTPPSEQNTLTNKMRIEFPPQALCDNKIDALHQSLAEHLTNQEEILTEFIDQHPQIITLYTSIVNLIRSFQGQDNFYLTSDYMIIYSLYYGTGLEQIPSVFLDDLDLEQKENLTQFLQLAKTYIFIKNFMLEHRRCLPQVFQERLLIDYSNPLSFPPSEWTTMNQSSFNGQTPESQTTDQDENPPFEKHFLTLNIQYEMTAKLAPFLTAYAHEQSRILLQPSSFNIDHLSQNDLKRRYESDFVEAFQNLMNFYTERTSQ